MSIKYLLLLIVLVTSCNVPTKKSKNQKIVFVGDLLLDRGVRDRINHLGIDNLFHQSIDSIFKTSNIVIANLECPATNIEEPINKKYIFRANPEWLKALKNHGITHLNLANNHSMDQGRNGLVDTNKNILENDMTPLGFGINIENACSTQLLATGPRNIYVISSVQVPSENWTYLENKPCICEEPINQIINRVKKIRSKDPNSVVIVQLHWGFEHTLKPTSSQKQQAYKLIDAGTDCIIGHHPHTIQSIEYYKGKPIYYSIGNFIFDQTNSINSKGLMVQLNITKKDIEFDTIQFLIKKSVPQLQN